MPSTAFNRAKSLTDKRRRERERNRPKGEFRGTTYYTPQGLKDREEKLKERRTAKRKKEASGRKSELKMALRERQEQGATKRRGMQEQGATERRGMQSNVELRTKKMAAISEMAGQLQKGRKVVNPKTLMVETVDALDPNDAWNQAIKRVTQFYGDGRQQDEEKKDNVFSGRTATGEKAFTDRPEAARKLFDLEESSQQAVSGNGGTELKEKNRGPLRGIGYQGGTLGAKKNANQSKRNKIPWRNATPSSGERPPLGSFLRK